MPHYKCIGLVDGDLGFPHKNNKNSVYCVIGVMCIENAYIYIITIKTIS